MKNAPQAPSGIILFAKQPGKTSFSSLFTVKRALDTKKVGHTGTLDSFAQGLLVVLSGGMTRLVPYITEFDKTYEAVISFGAETDTLDPNGEVIRTAPLPAAATLTGVVARFRGELDQKPPLYSAVHVDGKRASDVARKGSTVDIPSRRITVFSSEIIEMLSENGDVIPPFDLSAAGELVKYAHIRFHVSKGTYIRSLARDIADACGSAAHLAGLLRTQVGSFRLSDAVGADRLKPFSISGVLSENQELQERKARIMAERAERENARPDADGAPAEKKVRDEAELALEEAVRNGMKAMSPSVAEECGLSPATLKISGEKRYFHGQPLSCSMFSELSDGLNAAFTEDGVFAGVVSVRGERVSYQYVVPRQEAIGEVKTGQAAAGDTASVHETDAAGAGYESESSETSEADLQIALFGDEEGGGSPQPSLPAESAYGKHEESLLKDAALDSDTLSDDEADLGQGDLFGPEASDAGSSFSDTDVKVKLGVVKPEDRLRANLRVITWEELLEARDDENCELRSYFSNGSALTIGGFDGPHSGHLKLFDAVISYALKSEYSGGPKLKKGVVTFRQPPHSVTSPNLFAGDISTLDLKVDLFALKGFDFVIVIDFSSDFSRMKGNDFLSILKDCCSMQFAAAGCDFRCGHQLDTGVAELSAFARQNDFQFQVIDDVTYKGTRISSSLIRNCIQAGRLQEAETLLGRPYTVDLRKVTGSIRNDVHCLLQIAHGDVLQILPPEGDYPVRATSAGARICNTVLHVDSSLLRLEIPPEWSSTGIEKIEFTSLVS